jgi:hypothetical protein
MSNHDQQNNQPRNAGHYPDLTTLDVSLETATAAMGRVLDRSGNTPDVLTVLTFLHALNGTNHLSTLQTGVDKWVLACFGQVIRDSIPERCHRLMEEAVETVQSLGATRDECHMLVDYVFNRPPGEAYQEVGGLMICLAALCNAANINMQLAAITELQHIWVLIDKIREKQKTKPASSPLPGVTPAECS